MKKIAVIGAGEFQNPLILRARALGYEVHAFAWKCGDVGEKTADCFYPVSITEKEQILEICKGIRPEAVVSIASDLAVLTVNYVAAGLGLACNSERCAAVSTNKLKMRQAFQAAGIPAPRFALADEARLPRDMQYPVIVKPTDRSGSRGVAKVTANAQYAQAVREAAGYSFEKKAIVEEYIEGDEYSCESISTEGRHHLLALTRKFTTGAPHFIETGHIQPAGLSLAMRETVQKAVFAALDALDIRIGASHAEFRITPDGQVRIIEIGARMGGDCIGSHLVPLSTGYDFLGMVIDTASGKEPVWEQRTHAEAAAVRFVLSREDIRILERIKKETPGLLVEERFDCAPAPQTVVDSSTRAGHYILAGDKEELLRRMEFDE